MAIQLGATDKGYVLKLGDMESSPFSHLDFHYSANTETHEVKDQLSDLLKGLQLEGQEYKQARMNILLKRLGEWRRDNPLIAVAKQSKVYELYMEYLSRTVKYDETTKQVIFLVALSAYSPNPLNLFVRGPSSTGKTYCVMQSIKFFPKEDVWLLGGLSPTALVHDYAKLEDQSGNEVQSDEVDWKSTEAKKIKNVVDLNRKILVFLESPKMETFEKLRPILSHDAAEIRYSFTDKTGKGTMRTRHIYLRGWPATIFCSVDPSFQEELATRSINITPEMTPQKYEAAIHLQGKKASEPWNHHNPDETLEVYRENIEDTRNTMAHFTAVVPYGEELAICYPHTQPRDMRDFGKLVALIQQYTYFHLWQRPWLKGLEEKDIVLATLRDFKQANQIFAYIAETTRTGIPGNVVSFFSEVMLPLKDDYGSAIDYEGISKKNIEVYGMPRSKATLKKYYLDPLMTVGWIDQDNDPDDKRRTQYHVIGGPVKTLSNFEAQFTALFNETRLEKWVEDTRRNRAAAITIAGETVDWAELPYRYFTEWI